MESQLPPPQLSAGMHPKGVQVLVSTIIVIFIATVFVALRFIQRRKASVKSDDWFCLASLLVGYGFTIIVIVMTTVGKAGHHTYEFRSDLPKATLFTLLFIASDIAAVACVSLAKISVLLFYRRIFAIEKRFSVATWVVGFIVFGWFVSTTLLLIFPSNPIEAEWKPWIPHTSIDHKVFWVTFSCINLVLDIVILCLPQPMIWKLNLSRRRKQQLSVVFLLGAFVCLASGIRVWFVTRMDTNDLAWTAMPVSIWNVVEMAASIICACLPMLPALYRDRWGSGSKKNSANTSNRTTSLYRRPLKAYMSWTGSSSSQRGLWGGDKYTDIDSTDQKKPLPSHEMKPIHVPMVR